MEILNNDLYQQLYQLADADVSQIHEKIVELETKSRSISQYEFQDR